LPQKEAMHYEKLVHGGVRCALCPHRCIIAPDRTGLCLARRNDQGTLRSLNYGKVTALALDPIEKKPLKRFHPGSTILSAGSFGCNFKCGFCQNWRISQQMAEANDVMPAELVEAALRTREQGNIGLAYTYNEPSVWYEFVYDCAGLARANGLKNVLVTNGYINPAPMKALLPFIDAMNIDLKSMRPGFYRDICQGNIQPVMDTIKLCAPACHVEVTTLLVPGKNDGENEIDALARWLRSVSSDMTLHLTRYHPDYRLDTPAMPRERVYALADIARQSLEHVFCGNV